ncbi:glutathione S-transferase family protein [Paradevosia shaoguanensis]|uniref:glutathione S-transferase family protein n=1 Tax=Paradevosia shaoguanensis TaxID=1335043 RepID=UPI003C76850F
MAKLTLISFPTCPYVQRAIIALNEKHVDFDVVYIDLANKPDWFLAISPLGKVPVLKVEQDDGREGVIFESAVILEYLEETAPGAKLHPADPLERAQHRAWMEFGSQVLADIWKLSVAGSEADLDAAEKALYAKFARLENTVVGPFFAGERFSNVDAVFGPAFRQIDAIESVTPTGLLDAFPKLNQWRQALRERESVRTAVPSNFVDLYLERLRNNGAAVLKKAA